MFVLPLMTLSVTESRIQNGFLQSGDIVNVDCTTIVDGFYGDASRMFLIGEVSEEKKKLVRVTKECLDEAVGIAKPWTTLGDFGYAINKRAKENGYSVVVEIGGHGVGVEFHEEPWVPHIGEPGTGMLLVPGMTITIEPMINMGTSDVYCDEDDGWTIYTDDGNLLPNGNIHWLLQKPEMKFFPVKEFDCTAKYLCSKRSCVSFTQLLCCLFVRKTYNFEKD